jgi:hypothetical protein
VQRAQADRAGVCIRASDEAARASAVGALMDLFCGSI